VRRLPLDQPVLLRQTQGPRGIPLDRQREARLLALVHGVAAQTSGLEARGHLTDGGGRRRRRRRRGAATRRALGRARQRAPEQQAVILISSFGQRRRFRGASFVQIQVGERGAGGAVVRGASEEPAQARLRGAWI